MEVVYSIMLSEKSRIQKGLHKNRKAHAQNLEEIHKNEESVGMVALWVIFFFFFAIFKIVISVMFFGEGGNLLLKCHMLKLYKP